MTAMIEIRDLVKRFGALTAVNGVSFSVGRGEVLGFLGPNGAGKSTTMRMITGFLAPDAGSVKIAGVDLATDSMKTRDAIGYLPEGAPLYGEMPVLGFLRFIAQVRGFSGKDATTAIRRTVDRLELGDVLGQPIETLSKGFKRRVGLAQAILHDPPVLILDEPTDGLDPNQKRQVRELIVEMAPEKAIIISTHLLEEVDAVCSRAIIIAHGRVIADGTPYELTARSRYHNAVVVTLPAGTAASVETSLAGLGGVAAVETVQQDSGAIEFTLLAKDGRPIITEVTRYLSSSGIEIDRLTAQPGRLEEVFRTVTTGGGDEAGRRP